MTEPQHFYAVLTYLAGFIFPLVGAGCGLVALWSLVGFVRGISADLWGKNQTP